MHGTCIVTAAEQWLNAAPFFRRKTRNRYKKTTLSRGCSAAAPQRSLIARSSLPKIMSSTSRPIYKSFIIFPSPPFFQAVSIVYPRSAPLYSGKLAELFHPRRRPYFSFCPNYMNKLCIKCKIPVGETIHPCGPPSALQLKTVAKRRGGCYNKHRKKRWWDLNPHIFSSERMRSAWDRKKNCWRV